MSAAVSPKRLNHQELFLERYDRLLKWAIQLTKPDRELARDLVQEAFVQFTVSGGDLIAIKNIDNYLFGVVRNTHLSHLRRTVRQQHDQLSTFELNGAENLVLTVDPRRNIQVKDELRAICRYACRRKETSITASVLILRFFHGYFPIEVAKLLHSSRNTVDVQLRAARFEAIACLAQSSSANYGSRSFVKPAIASVTFSPDLLTELRQEIFATRQGDCLHLEDLQRIYRTRKAITRGTISHLVSCAGCLDGANRLLGLPLLRERSAIDVLDRESDSTTNNGLTAIHRLMRHGIGLVVSWTVWLSITSLDTSLFDLLSA